MSVETESTCPDGRVHCPPHMATRVGYCGCDRGGGALALLGAQPACRFARICFCCGRVVSACPCSFAWFTARVCVRARRCRAVWRAQVSCLLMNGRCWSFYSAVCRCSHGVAPLTGFRALGVVPCRWPAKCVYSTLLLRLQHWLCSLLAPPPTCDVDILQSRVVVCGPFERQWRCCVSGVAVPSLVCLWCWSRKRVLTRASRGSSPLLLSAIHEDVMCCGRYHCPMPRVLHTCRSTRLVVALFFAVVAKRRACSRSGSRYSSTREDPPSSVALIPRMCCCGVSLPGGARCRRATWCLVT